MYDFWKKHDFLLLSFCTQGFRPELQNPIVFLSRVNLLHLGEDARKGG